MTADHPELHPAPPIPAPPTSPSLPRTWLYAGGMAIVVGLAYAAGTMMAPGGTPPSSESGSAMMVGSETEPSAEPSAEQGNPQAEPLEEQVLGDDGMSDTEAFSDQIANGEFYVQVAAYKDEADAKAYASTLSQRGLKAKSVDPSAGSSWHSVRLGPFTSRGDAEKARLDLKLHERMKAYVVPRSNGKYHVQVGSFATREKAEPVAKRFADRGHSTKISRVKMGARRWHCVRIGPFDTAEEAADYQDLVSDMAAGETSVIPYGPPKL